MGGLWILVVSMIIMTRDSITTSETQSRSKGNLASRFKGSKELVEEEKQGATRHAQTSKKRNLPNIFQQYVNHFQVSIGLFELRSQLLYLMLVPLSPRERIRTGTSPRGDAETRGLASNFLIWYHVANLG